MTANVVDRVRDVGLKMEEPSHARRSEKEGDMGTG